jgi:4-amino-4-deoxy-L-arabinose transferase-like glycosyltransferase
MTTAATRSPAADATGCERTPRARRGPPPALVVLLGATFVLAIAWALVTPAFQAPDEQSHFGYVQSLVEGPGLPGQAGRPLFSSEQTLAASQSNADQVAAQPHVKMEWSPLVYERWRAADAALPPAARSDGGGPNPASGNPPLYYLVEAPAYAAARGGDVFDRLLAMRIASLLWLLVTVTAVWLLAGEVFARDRLLQLVAASVAGLAPMMSFVSASVTPDAMMFALWSLVLWLGVRILRRGMTWPLALALCGLVGAAGCVKATSYALIPAALFALAVGLWRLRPWRAGPTLAAAAAGAAGLALTLGVWNVVAHAAERAVSAQFSAATSTGGVLDVRFLLSYVWQFYLPRFPFQNDVFPTVSSLPLDSIWLQGAWGSFGWLEVDFPPLVYDVLIAVTVIVVIAAGTTLWRTRRTTDWAVAVFFSGLTVTLLAGLHWTEFQLLSRGGGLLNQGRYLLPLAGLAGLCVAQALRLLPPRLRPYGVSVVMGGLLALQLLALGLMTDRYFA